MDDETPKVSVLGGMADAEDTPKVSVPNADDTPKVSVPRVAVADVLERHGIPDEGASGCVPAGADVNVVGCGLVIEGTGARVVVVVRKTTRVVLSVVITTEAEVTSGMLETVMSYDW